MLLAMTRDSTTSEEKSSRSYWGFVLWPVVVVVLYVLSYGPVWRLCVLGNADWKLIRAYDPVDWVAAATGLKRPLNMYLLIWRPEVPDVDTQPVTGIVAPNH